MREGVPRIGRAPPAGTHRVSDLAPSSNKPQMSRLPVRVKALFMAPVPALGGRGEGMKVEKVQGISAEGPAEPLLSRYRTCDRHRTYPARKLETIPRAAQSLAAPHLHTDVKLRHHGQPTSRGKHHPAAGQREAREWGHWSSMTARWWDAMVGRRPTKTPPMLANGQQPPPLPASGKAWGKVCDSASRPRRCSTCSSCFLPSMPCRDWNKRLGDRWPTSGRALKADRERLPCMTLLAHPYMQQPAHLHHVCAVQAVDTVGAEHAALLAGGARIVTEPVPKATEVGRNGLQGSWIHHGRRRRSAARDAECGLKRPRQIPLGNQWTSPPTGCPAGHSWWRRTAYGSQTVPGGSRRWKWQQSRPRLRHMPLTGGPRVLFGWQG